MWLYIDGISQHCDHVVYIPWAVFVSLVVMFYQCHFTHKLQGHFSEKVVREICMPVLEKQPWMIWVNNSLNSNGTCFN